jgi:energy-coupling factor transport system permease protein/energy-coupling factor transport system ATP-binding protein
MRRAGSLAVAMDARGFAHANRRTWAEPAPWLRGDWVVVAIGTMLAALPWFLR